MNWFFIALNWYFFVLILGLIFFPITKKIFGKFFFDSGYPFSKTIAIIVLSYIIFNLSFFKIIPFEKNSLLILLILASLFNLKLFKKEKRLSKSEFKIIIFEEMLFLIAFIFWVIIRGQEPSIHSLEKFMDFGFINSILRTKYFPPLDIWFSGNKNHLAGFPINYYYFGHLSGALLIKLTNIKSAIGYNLILSTIFGLGISQAFSLSINIINYSSKKLKKAFSKIKLVLFGLLGSFIINLTGNLHTIYAFTKGYPNEKPIPFWKIFSWYNPSKYWYPNATRFIPFTIHEFPSYSYVVADLHGHVFDIPFVLLTISILFIIFIKGYKNHQTHWSIFKQFTKDKLDLKSQISKLFSTNFNQSQLISVLSLGFLTSIHYMTNAFDGPIYILLSIFILLLILGFSYQWIISLIILIISFVIFSLPFSLNFTPFVSGIGVNCSPDFLLNYEKIGPFLFEKGNCQLSPFWMLFILWGFFLTSFLILIISLIKRNKKKLISPDIFCLLLFSLGTFLIIIPEFFYIKDIYPAHFRANTMFKLGYQAFIMMGIASVYALYRTNFLTQSNKKLKIVLRSIFIFLFFLIFIYPFFSIPSYYGKLDRPVILDGSKWLETSYPEDKEIIDFINTNIKSQPTILEAQGDSYTDYERISAYTGLPTVAGWWVHEWLWRGSANIVGDRIPDIVKIYESEDIQQTKRLINKYQIKYIIISQLERKKYPNIKENKFNKIGQLIFKSKNNLGLLYKVN